MRQRTGMMGRGRARGTCGWRSARIEWLLFCTSTAMPSVSGGTIWMRITSALRGVRRCCRITRGSSWATGRRARDHTRRIRACVFCRSRSKCCAIVPSIRAPYPFCQTLSTLHSRCSRSLETHERTPSFQIECTWCLPRQHLLQPRRSARDSGHLPWDTRSQWRRCSISCRSSSEELSGWSLNSPIRKRLTSSNERRPLRKALLAARPTMR
mmetsp:Transcript_8496/g.16456  ORF Transcript_8496/g.16456 Transcript_8496/m.16456 type:complete len:211 (+) Transcript_8496:1313-1945(+)